MAYHTALLSIQRMEPENLPFQNYLVQLQKEIPAEGFTNLHFNERAIDGMKLRGDDIKDLDESQRKAVNLVKENKIALIQGPPGF